MKTSLKPLVSVVMPVHNAEKYLAEAISSILYQTYTNFEFIIVNDGSSDTSESIIKKINDTRIVYHKFEQQQGIVAALNYGLQLAKGDFVARMDADDVCYKNRLEVQVNYLLSHPDVGVLGTQYKGIKGKSRPLPNRHDQIVWYLLNASPFVHPSVMFRANFLHNNHMLYDKQFEFAEDLNLWVEHINTTNYANTSETLIQYRYHTGTHKANLIRVGELNTLIKIKLIKQLLPGLDLGKRTQFAYVLNRHIKHDYDVNWLTSTLTFLNDLVLLTNHHQQLIVELNRCLWFHLTAYPELYYKHNKQFDNYAWFKLNLARKIWLLLKFAKQKTTSLRRPLNNSF
jgi:glycosyltransferase involved in cell wall biosynthesis